MPDLKDDWVIRPAEANELNFIYATWLNSHRDDSTVGLGCRKSVFFSEYPRIIDEILNRSQTKVSIACSKEMNSLILAYLVYEGPVLHYLFTKEIYRKCGIATDLFIKAFGGTAGLIAGPIEFTHRTLSVEPILQKYRDHLNFNPFKLYKQPENGGKNNEGPH